MGSIIIAILIIASLFYIRNKFTSKSESSYQKSESSSNHKSGTSTPKRNTPPAIPYVEKIVSEVYDSEYIANLRVGRSWILPQFVEMNFGREGKYNKKRFINDISTLRSFAYCWKVMLNNYRVMAMIEKKDPEGYAQRNCWWTKQVAIDMATVALRAMSIKDAKSSGRNNQILRSITDASSSTELYHALQRCLEDSGIMNIDASVPQSFISAFAGDGAFNAMMTMVKYLKLNYKGSDGNELTRDQCIEDIKAKALEFNYDGLKMLDYCQQKYFDNHLFDYQRYIAR